MFNYKAASNADKLIYALQATTSQTGEDLRSLAGDIEELGALVRSLLELSSNGELSAAWVADLRQLNAFTDMAEKSLETLQTLWEKQNLKKKTEYNVTGI